MDDIEIFNPQELGRRQQLAAARRQRDSARLALLAQLVDTQRRADELKSWISAYARPANETSYPPLGRMLEWAASQLDDLERILSPERLSETLQERELFPETDLLNDPKGEPLHHRIWGHSSALGRSIRSEEAAIKSLWRD
jgi:hypothetical protein